MLLLILNGGIATAQQVAYNYMAGSDFSYTYKWVHIPSNVHRNQIVSQEIRDVVNNDLAARGFTLASGKQADLYVG